MKTKEKMNAQIEKRFDPAEGLPRAVAILGRTLAEYERFLDFKIEGFRGKRVLDCAAGAASFTAEAMRRNVRAVGVDPLYGRQAGALREIARLDIAEAIDRVKERPELFELNGCDSVENLRKARLLALEEFERDYIAGRASGRYLNGTLPRLPLKNNAFELVLCAHFLFLYADRLDYAFHYSACRELCRVCCGEVRIYPLVDMEGRTYANLERLLTELRYCGINGEVVEVDYAVLRGSDHALVLRREYNFT